MSADPVTLTAIASIIGAGATAGSALGLFGGSDSPQQPAAKEVTTPTVMPTPDDDAAKRARAKQSAALTQRRGRQSTILSEPTSTDLLGG